MNQKQKFGRAGENFAAEILQLSGYEILERNYRCKDGEIDIIAQRPPAVSTSFRMVKASPTMTMRKASAIQ